MSFNLKDLTVYFVVLTLIVLVNLSFTFIPWSIFLLLVGLASTIGLYGYYGGEFSNPVRGGRNGVKVEPVEAPERINEKARENELYKEMDLEKTGKSSTKVHVDTQDVRIDGENTNLMFGIIAMPRNPYKREYIAYILDLNEDRIRKYDSQRYEAGARIQPFEGKYSWLTARGLERKVVDDEHGSDSRVVINQNTGNQVNDNERENGG